MPPAGGISIAQPCPSLACWLRGRKSTLSLSLSLSLLLYFPVNFMNTRCFTEQTSRSSPGYGPGKQGVPMLDWQLMLSSCWAAAATVLQENILRSRCTVRPSAGATRLLSGNSVNILNPLQKGSRLYQVTFRRVGSSCRCFGHSPCIQCCVESQNCP